MAVLAAATASGRQFYSGSLTTTGGTVLYTAPSQSANVTSPSATAYIKEIILANTTASAVTVTMAVGGTYIMSTVSIASGDTKVLSGLNTMMTAGSTITGNASAAGQIYCIISGVEVV